MAKKIVVLGSFVVDLMGRAPGLPVAGETVKGGYFKLGPGGKGSNQAVAACKAGAEVLMITKLGTDFFGDIAFKCFTDVGIDTRHVLRTDESSTGAALIMVDAKTGQNIILVVPGACEQIELQQIESARDSIENASVLLTQLETNFAPIELAVDIAYSKRVPIILNPAPIQGLPEALLQKVYVLTPNEVEAAALSGIEVKTPLDASRAAEALMRMGVRNVIITMGQQGAYVASADKQQMLPGIRVNAIDATGAGDAFSGGLAAAISEGLDLFDAARFAMATAALSVTKIGTAPAMPTRVEIDALLQIQGWN